MTAPPPGATGPVAALRQREFQAVVASSVLSVAGDQVTRLAVALLVSERTGSSFLAAATYACSYLTWLLGGPVLSVVADRLRRRELMVGCDLVRAALVALLLAPGVPLAVVFAVLVLVGLLSPPFDAAKSAVLPEVLGEDLYPAGAAVLNAVLQGAQVAGFVVGGALVAALGTGGALAVDVATYVLSALLLGAGLAARAAPGGSSGSVLRDVRDGVGLVLADPRLRALLAFGVLAVLAMIVPEGLAVPVARHLGGGPVAAGVLTAAVPAGYLVGSVLVLRLSLPARTALLPRLLLLSCVPLLATPLAPSVVAVTALWVLTGVGTALGVVANAAYMTAVPPALRGRAYGVAITTIMGGQGVVLLLVGGLADALTPPATAGVAGAVLLGAALLLLRGRAAEPALTPVGEP